VVAVGLEHLSDIVQVDDSSIQIGMLIGGASNLRALMVENDPKVRNVHHQVRHGFTPRSVRALPHSLKRSHHDTSSMVRFYF
jgi:hypothetical protein